MELQDTQRPHWSFDRRINVGHLLTTLSAIAAIFLWAMRVEMRFTELTIQNKVYIESAAQQTQELRLLNDKVQQLIELNAYQRGLAEHRK